MRDPNIILETRGVSCSKQPANKPGSCVRDVSLAIQAKTVNLILGSEGGADVLLRLLGLLDPPAEGEILLRGEAIGALGEDVRADLRNRHYGFLFVQPFLLPSFSVIENVAMPLFKLSGVGPEEAQQRTRAVLEFTGMERYAEAAVAELTTTQQHRVSLARALVNQPDILILENVDAEMAGDELFDFLENVRRAASAFGTTSILTASQKELARFADRVIEVADGAIARDSRTAVENGGAKV